MAMQQGSDYGYYSLQYPPSHPYPGPNPRECPPSNPAYASAPPYSQYAATDLPSYPSSYAPYSQTPDPVPSVAPSAPSYSQPQTQAPQFPPNPQYNPPPYSAEQFYYSQEPHQPPGSYGFSPNPNPNVNANANPSPSFSSPYSSYENPYESTAQRFDQGSGYVGDDSSRYGASMTGSCGRSSSGFDQDFYDKRPDGGYRYDHASVQDDVLGAGVYRYDGGGAEPYGARGTGGPSRSSSSSWSAFDDYGRSTSFSSTAKEQGGGGMGKIATAVPTAETHQDVKSGVQKFRVNLLAEGSGQSTVDVLCQV